MKTVVKLVACAAAMVGMACSSFGQETKDKTKRMLVIEKKFNITMTLVIEQSPTNLWIFMAPDSNSDFKFVPVVVKADAKDAEIQAACLAVGACANFYDKAIAKKKAESLTNPGSI